MENYKVGTLKRYRLDYASMRKLNPGLIYCSITGFGQDGPFAQRAGYDFMIQGMAGVMSITGAPQTADCAHLAILGQPVWGANRAGCGLVLAKCL